MEADRDLIERCLQEEDSAWEALLKIHTGKIYSLCYRFTGQRPEAEDLTQEVFIKVFQTLRSFDPLQGQFTTWLNRVARNHLVDHYRRTKKDRLTSSLDEEGSPTERQVATTVDPASHVQSREQREVLQAALDRLSPEMREAVILRDLQDLDYAEIAQVLRVPEGTVKSRINRGRLELARVLKRIETLRSKEEGQ